MFGKLLKNDLKAQWFSVSAIYFCAFIAAVACEIGANVSEGEKAQSKADFYTKMTIALKEANETDYWLRLMYATEYLTEQEFESLSKDNKEIISILVAITKTTKQDLIKK